MTDPNEGPVIPLPEPDAVAESEPVETEVNEDGGDSEQPSGEHQSS